MRMTDTASENGVPQAILISKIRVFVLITIVALTMSDLTNAQPKSQEVRVADLPEGLIATLLTDAVCGSTVRTPATNVDRARFVKENAVVQTVVDQQGRELGAIVRPIDLCNCGSANCRTLVYRKEGQNYIQLFADSFVSLKPMTLYTNGFPNLVGHFHDSAFEFDRTVFAWNGHNYEAVVCEKWTQQENEKTFVVRKRQCQNEE